MLPFTMLKKSVILGPFLLQLVRFGHTVGREGETAVGYRFLEGKANMEGEKSRAEEEAEILKKRCSWGAKKEKVLH